MSEFGPLVSASQVEAAILGVIETWMHTYMGQTERDTGRAVELDAPPTVLRQDGRQPAVDPRP
jgi:hypothetical protein